MIPPKSKGFITVHSLPSGDRDFLFEPDQQEHVALFAHVVNSKTTKFLVKNDSNFLVRLNRG